MFDLRRRFNIISSSFKSGGCNISALEYNSVNTDVSTLLSLNVGEMDRCDCTNTSDKLVNNCWCSLAETPCIDFSALIFALIRSSLALINVNTGCCRCWNIPATFISKLVMNSLTEPLSTCSVNVLMSCEIDLQKLVIESLIWLYKIFWFFGITVVSIECVLSSNILLLVSNSVHKCCWLLFDATIVRISSM